MYFLNQVKLGAILMAEWIVLNEIGKCEEVQFLLQQHSTLRTYAFEEFY